MKTNEEFIKWIENIKKESMFLTLELMQNSMDPDFYSETGGSKGHFDSFDRANSEELRGMIDGAFLGHIGNLLEYMSQFVQMEPKAIMSHYANEFYEKYLPEMEKNFKEIESIMDKADRHATLKEMVEGDDSDNVRRD